ncbi:hypothetical protein D3C76_1758670 [compost metagenome]
MVGQGGQLYARVKPETRRLLINWGSNIDQQCALLIPAAADASQQLVQVDAVCAASKQVAERAPITNMQKVKL